MINIPERYRQVSRLGIDEHSHRKGKKDYLCILTDLDKGIIIDILPMYHVITGTLISPPPRNAFLMQK